MACLSINNHLTEITHGPFTQLAISETHICALREDGIAFSQGRNDLRQASPPPAKFAQIAAGRFHNCGITRANRLECWRSPRPGSAGERITAPDSEFTAIARRWQNSCALRPNGRAICWHTPKYLPLDNPPDGVSLATAGANLGWPLCEADICKDWASPATLANLAPPALAYGRDVGCVVIGGVTVPWLDNGFIFSDLYARRIWLLERNNPPDSVPAGAQETTQNRSQAWRMREIADLSPSTHHIIHFGAGADGSVYVLPRTGSILRLDPSLVGNLPDSPPNQ